jgi:hypothetical protein
MANTYTDLLKLRMPALGDVGWDDEVNDNAMLLEFALGSLLKSNVVIDGLMVSDGGGLDVDIAAGNVVVGGAAYAVSADTLTCTSGVKNWVYVDDTGALQAATIQPAGHYVALALVDAASAAIERIGDARNFAEGALTIGVDYTPSSYSPDTGETGAINQHLAGIDEQLGIMAYLKNKIVNPDLLFWQRGDTVAITGSSTYGPDGYCSRDLGSMGASSAAWIKQTFTPGQTDVPGEPEFFARWSIVGSTSAGYWDHRVENVRTMGGKALKLVLYMKAPQGALDITITALNHYGSGGSAIDSTAAQGFSLTTSWQKIATEITFPSLSGKTIGPRSYNMIRVQTAQTGSYQIDFAHIRGIIGPQYQELPDRPPALEWLLVQRYYEKSYDVEVAPGTVSSSGCHGFIRPNGSGGTGFPFRVVKWTTPTMYAYSPTTGAVGKCRNDVAGADATCSFAFVGTAGAVPGASASVTDGCRVHWVADASIK